ncbi:MAG: hypothetical protein SF053_04360 [Bacteroidia bacterium]|nr:hypothetical protein [Bacteroidia bacterium]
MAILAACQPDAPLDLEINLTVYDPSGAPAHGARVSVFFTEAAYAAFDKTSLDHDLYVGEQGIASLYPALYQPDISRRDTLFLYIRRYYDPLAGRFDTIDNRQSLHYLVLKGHRTYNRDVVLDRSK